jgi:hypothetical protein
MTSAPRTGPTTEVVGDQEMVTAIANWLHRRQERRLVDMLNRNTESLRRLSAAFGGFTESS